MKVKSIRSQPYVSLSLTLMFILVFAVSVINPASTKAAPTFFNPTFAPYKSAQLTRDAADTYNLSGNSSSVTISTPPTNIGSNSRAIFWPNTQKKTINEQVCATWQSQNGPVVQQGVALRIKAQANGRVRAITVTKNIFTTNPQVAGTWKFNVLLWDTKKAGGFTIAKSYDLAPVFNPNGQVAALPWTMCARVINSTFSFKVWPNTHSTPAWGDSRYGGTIALAKGWSFKGNHGWYIGHLHKNNNARYTNMTASPL
jgi:hypothetical protein